MENLPKNWVNISFTDLLGINGGTQPPKSQFIYEPKEGYIRLLQIRDFGKKPVPTYVPNTGKLRTCLSEDVLIARYGASIGRIVTGQEGAYNVALAKVNIPEDINKNFIKWLLKSHLFQNVITSFQRTAQSGFNKDDLSRIIIPLPPLPEQQRIVAKLDGLFGHLDSLKQRLELIPALLKQFRQSVLTQAVTGKLTEEWREGKELDSVYILNKCKKEREGLIKIKSIRKENIIPKENNALNDLIPNYWKLTSMLSISSKITQGPNPKIAGLEDKKYRLLKTKDFYDNIIYYDNCQTLSEENYKQFERFKLETGDLIIGLVGVGSTGKSNIFIEQENADFIFTRATGLIRLAIKSLVNPLFIKYFLNSSMGKELIDNITEGTTGQTVIKTSSLKKILVPLPSSEEQTEIVKRVEGLFDKADTIEAAYDKLKQQIDSLPQAILAKAFKGELVEQLPTDGSAKELLAEIQKLKTSLQSKKKPVKRKVKVKK